MKNRFIKLLIVFFLSVFPAIPVFAIWNPGDPNVMHIPQLPDISETGLVILATPTSIADDFLSSQSALITDITLWGAWLDDKVGPLDLNIAIFSNIPAGIDNIPYSRPGNLLWYHYVSAAEIEETGVADYNIPLYDPRLNAEIGLTSIVIQYDIKIDPNKAFWQHKDTIYWLVVQRLNLDDGNFFGWINSFSRLNSSGIFEYIPNGGGQHQLRQLLYPITHQYVGQGIDLAFVIATSSPAANDGNFDGDGNVDFSDLAILAKAWLTEDGQTGWNPDCDISNPADNFIGIEDIAVFVQHWLEGI